MMKILYYDCFSGISGDMNLGALIDAGVDKDYLTFELSKLNIDGYELNIKKDVKNGISGTKVDVVLKNNSVCSHQHRNLEYIENMISSSSLSSKVKKMSKGIFKKVAQAEAKVHSKPINEVHFHEVGAVDSIVDIVGAAICFDYLNVDKVEASKVEVGSGFVKCAHGILPVPAPATAEILKNVPIESKVNFEATTPTGAAILSYLCPKFTSDKDFKVTKIGYGIGSKDNDDIPNVLRVFIGEPISYEKNSHKNCYWNKDEKTEYILDRRNMDKSSSKDELGCIREEAQVIECNIDDMNPEKYQYIIDKLLQIGALDAYLTPIIMKKGRPAVKLSVLYKDEAEEEIRDIVLTETTTLGFRKHKIERNMLYRDFTKVVTKYGQVNVKNAYYKGKKIKSKIEYEDCKKLALKNKISIDDIYREVMSKTFK
nr:nickel pincer cofactor biosynthesis protein LarC [Clostridium ragsdalei]